MARSASKLTPVLPIASTALPIAFNAATSTPRLVLLVSPTCPLCLAGVEIVLNGLEANPARDLAVFVVWLPVLDEDSADAAVEVANAISPRVAMAQFWDADRDVSTAVHAVLDLTARRRRIAWDLYLFYRAGVEWQRAVPSPDIWLHQLDIADQPSLDNATLLDALRAIASY